MKTKTIIISLVVFALIVCMMAVYVNIRLRSIDPSQIEMVEFAVYGKPQSYKWTDEDVSTLVRLYNSAQYVGPADGSGGTPDYDVLIHFRDGSSLRLYEFNGIMADYEVAFTSITGIRSKEHFVKSEALRDYLDELFAMSEQ